MRPALLGLVPLFAALAQDPAAVLQSRCSGCHATILQMNAKAILERVTRDGPGRMPFKQPALPSTEIAALRRWAERRLHWAFLPVQHPAPPAVKNASWPRNLIDRFILARLEKDGIAPSSEAAKRTQLRRLSLDLTGLPPTPEEMATFLDDPRPDAYERQVDRLLASPHFGERWARPWLDVARYADSDGYEKDWFRPWAWRYRQWVIEAFNRDEPFDQFTIDQIAGDLIPNATVNQHVATGFHRNTLTNREGGVDNNQFRFDNTIDRTSTVATAWLGLTAGCAQCHDHKYDPISQREFYQLFAFFDNVEEVQIDAPAPGEPEKVARTQAEYRRKRNQLLTSYKVPELMADWERRLLEARAHPGQSTDWDLAWDCVLKLTEGGDGEKILLKPASQRTQREVDVITDHFVRAYVFAVGKKSFEVYHFDDLREKLTKLAKHYPQFTQALAIAESDTPHPTQLRLRGNYKALGDEVQPGVPGILPPLKSNGRATRMDFARWIVSRDNPLTARVAVNRIWQELFGQGLVKSSDDFGTRGDAPSHPELLDWLASEYMDRGWSTKAMIRLIVTSATYRQASAGRPDLEEKDPSNTLLARQSRLRLPAELIRDEALAGSGLLNMDVGGPSVRPPQPLGVTELGYAKKAGESWDESTGRDRYRRGLYVQFQRSTPYPQLINFDAPKGSGSQCRRERSNTPLQALNLLNDPVFNEAAQALANRLPVGDFEPRLERAFQLSLGRNPSAAEVETLRRYYEREKSWSGLCSVLLNLDEFITRE